MFIVFFIGKCKISVSNTKKKNIIFVASEASDLFFLDHSFSMVPHVSSFVYMGLQKCGVIVVVVVVVVGGGDFREVTTPP